MEGYATMMDQFSVWTTAWGSRHLYHAEAEYLGTCLSWVSDL